MNVFIDIDIEIDIFKSDLIDVDIFKTCRYINNRYGLSIYGTPLRLLDKPINQCFEFLILFSKQGTELIPFTRFTSDPLSPGIWALQVAVQGTTIAR